MPSVNSVRTPWWTWTWPVLALVVLGVHTTLSPGVPFAAAEAFALIATVFAAVYHAEVVAHRVGEPFGTLVLALAVTIIEVALIVSMMITGGSGTAGLARDTVFAAVMIVCNGIVGLCLLAGGVRHREQGFQFQGAQAALSVLIALTTLTLIFPNVTSTAAGATFSSSQLVFAAIVSLILYGSFLFVQTVRHRDYFLPAGDDEEAHAPPPPNRIALVSAGLLLVSLVAVVVLLPEGLASYRTATANRLQTSMNLALGSVLATIGLTIPAVASVSMFLSRPLTLGLGAKEELLLAVTLLVCLLTIGTGRTTVLQGIVHLVLFAVFLFFAAVP